MSRNVRSPLYLGMTLEIDVRRTYASLRAGGLVLVPADLGYRLLAMEEPAVRRIYELKRRPTAKPCVTVAIPELLTRVAQPIADDVREWLADITRLTPITIVTRAATSPLLDELSPYVRGRATHDETIALCFRAGRLLERLAELALADGKLLIGSSAKVSGTGSNYTFDAVPALIRNGVDFALDHGPAWFRNDARLASTVLDLATGSFLRKGINYARIAESWDAMRAAG